MLSRTAVLTTLRLQRVTHCQGKACHRPTSAAPSLNSINAIQRVGFQVRSQWADELTLSWPPAREMARTKSMGHGWEHGDRPISYWGVPRGICNRLIERGADGVLVRSPPSRNLRSCRGNRGLHIEVFQHRVAFASLERTTATSASDFAVSDSGIGSDSNDAVLRIAIRTHKTGGFELGHV